MAKHDDDINYSVLDFGNEDDAPDFSVLDGLDGGPAPGKPKRELIKGRLKKIGIEVPDDVINDAEQVYGLESGRSHFAKPGVVKRGPPTKGGSRAIGYTQIMPGTAAKYKKLGLDPMNEIDNQAMGIAEFYQGSDDPIGRRLAYVGGPKSKALEHYKKTGEVPDWKLYSYLPKNKETYKGYVEKSGGFADFSVLDDGSGSGTYVSDSGAIQQEPVEVLGEAVPEPYTAEEIAANEAAFPTRPWDPQPKAASAPVAPALPPPEALGQLPPAPDAEVNAENVLNSGVIENMTKIGEAAKIGVDYRKAGAMSDSKGNVYDLAPDQTGLQPGQQRRISNGVSHIIDPDMTIRREGAVQAPAWIQGKTPPVTQLPEDPVLQGAYQQQLKTGVPDTEELRQKFLSGYAAVKAGTQPTILTEEEKSALTTLDQAKQQGVVPDVQTEREQVVAVVEKPVVDPAFKDQSLDDAFRTANEYQASQNLPPISREEFDAAQAGGTAEVADVALDRPAGAATFSAPRQSVQASEARGNLDGLVGTYKPEDGESDESAFRNAYLEAGSKYGLTPQMIDQKIAKLKATGKPLFISRTPGNAIGVSFRDLQDAGLSDIATDVRMEEAQATETPVDMRLAQPAATLEDVNTAESKIDATLREGDTAMRTRATKFLSNPLNLITPIGTMNLGSIFDDLTPSDIAEEKKRLLDQHGSYLKAWEAEKYYQGTSGAEIGARLVAETARSFAKNIVSGTGKSAIFISQLLEDSNPLNIVMPDKLKVGLRNVGNAADLITRVISSGSGETAMKEMEWVPGTSDIDKQQAWRSLQEFDKAIGEDKVLKGRLLGSLANAAGSAAAFIALGALMPSMSLGRVGLRASLRAGASRAIARRVAGMDLALGLSGGIQSAGTGYEEGKQSGLSETESRLLGVVQFGLGTSEMFGAGTEVASILKNNTMRGRLAAAFLEIPKVAWREGKQELAQETFQTASGEIVKTYLQDKDPSTFAKLTRALNRLPGQIAKAAVNEGVIGFITGGVMGGAGAAAGQLRDGSQVKAAPSPQMSLPFIQGDEAAAVPPPSVSPAAKSETQTALPLTDEMQKPAQSAAEDADTDRARAIFKDPAFAELAAAATESPMSVLKKAGVPEVSTPDDIKAGSIPEKIWDVFDKNVADNVNGKSAIVKIADLVSTEDLEVKHQDELQLDSAKAHPVVRAFSHINAAMTGAVAKRAPLLVQKNAEGKLEVLDGNSTLETLKRAGWSEVPIVEVPRPMAAARNEPIAKLSHQAREYAVGEASGYLEDVRKVAAEVGGVVPKRVDAFAVKSENSLNRKLALKPNKVPSDLLRTMILLPKGPATGVRQQIAQAVQGMADLGYQIVVDENGVPDVADRFSSPEPGYKDFAVKFEKGANDPLVRELQFLQPAMYRAKEGVEVDMATGEHTEVPGKPQHINYDAIKDLNELFEQAPGLSREKAEQAIADIKIMAEEMNVAYAAAYAEDPLPSVTSNNVRPSRNNASRLRTVTGADESIRDLTIPSADPIPDVVKRNLSSISRSTSDRPAKYFNASSNVVSSKSSIPQKPDAAASRLKKVAASGPEGSGVRIMAQPAVARQMSSKGVTSALQENFKPLLAKPVDEMSEDEVVASIVEPARQEIKHWLANRGDYKGFYTDDRVEADKQLKTWAKTDRGIDLTPEDVSLYHLVSSFGSPQADPIMDSSKGLEVFDRYLRTGVLSGLGDKQTTVWTTTPEKGRHDTNQLRFADEGDPVKGRVTRTYQAENLKQFDKLADTFPGERREQVRAAVKWLGSKQSIAEIEKRLGSKPAASEYMNKNTGGYGVFAITGTKLGSYFLNRTGNLDTVTKDMWYARSIARYLGMPLTEGPAGKALATPWSDRTVSGIRHRELADEAFAQLGAEFNMKPAEVQQALWDFEKKLWEHLGHPGEANAFISKGLTKGIENITAGLPELTSATVGVAPLRIGTITKLSGAPRAFAGAVYQGFLRQHADLAKVLDLNVHQLSRSIGAYEDTSANLEASLLPTVTGPAPAVDLYATLMSVLAPDIQHSALVSSYEIGGPDQELRVTFKTSEAAEDFVNNRKDVGIENLSYIPETRTAILLNIAEYGGLDLAAFRNKYDGQIENIEERNANVRFLAESDYAGVVQGARDSVQKYDRGPRGPKLSTFLDTAESKLRDAGLWDGGLKSARPGSGSRSNLGGERAAAAIRGGTAEASAIAGAGERAIPAERRWKYGEDTAPFNQEIKRQEDALEKHARENGTWFKSDAFGKPSAAGGEALVYISDGATVTKTVDPRPRTNPYGTPERFLAERIDTFNKIFPESAYALKGFMRDDKGKFRVVVEQPLVVGEHVTSHAPIREMMAAKGFKVDGFQDTYTDGVYKVIDLNPQNVIVTADGQVIAIDAIPRQLVPAKPVATELPTKAELPGSLGIRRADMPQIRQDDHAEFIAFAADKGIVIAPERVSADRLKPTQNEYNPQNAAGIPYEKVLGKSLMVSVDDRVLDGHNTLIRLQEDPSAMVNILRVPLTAKKALELMHEFPKSETKSVAQVGATAEPGMKKSPALSKFLEGSVVQNVVYHGTGTPTDFEVFEGGWFTEDPAYASKYATGSNPRVIPAYLSLRKVATPEEASAAAEAAGVPDSEFSTWAKANYDGFSWQKPGMGTIYIPLKAAAVKSATGNNGNFDPNEDSILKKAKQPFYSPLAETIARKMPNKASADQIRGIIKDTKREELEFLGFDEFLGDRSGILKDEVLDFIQQNNVVVTEVVKSDRSTDEDVEQLMDEGWSREAAEQQAGSMAGETKYSQYTLPGGENYKELLLTMPDESSKQAQEYRRISSQYNEIAQDYSEEADGRRDEIERQLAVIRDAGLSTGEFKGYKSSHWDEPNVLAHARYDERVDADGRKVLHVAEIQSDWHQEGKKKGYDASGQMEAEVEAWWNDEGGANEETPFGELSAAEVRDAIAQYKTDVLEWGGDRVSGVPDAPFKKTWPLMTFKHVLRHAAENGFDSISWDTGETSADRYDLSKQVDSIDYHSGPTEGSRQIYINLPGGASLQLMTDADGKVTRASGYNPAGLEGKQLADVIGKETAQKVMDGVGDVDAGLGKNVKRLAGNNLKVGGEGMVGFYDKILPAEVNKYVKKWGAKVEQSKLGGTANTDEIYHEGDKYAIGEDGPAVYNSYAEAAAALPGVNGTPIHLLMITDAMRDSITRDGQPLFRKRTPEQDRLLNRELPEADDVDVVTGIEGGILHPNGEFEMGPHEAEILRRMVAHRHYLRNGKPANETSFEGVVWSASYMRNLAEFGRTAGRAAIMEGGVTDEQLAGFDTLMNNLDAVADANDRVGYAVNYVFDSALPHERMHREDLTAGRTSASALRQLQEHPLWDTKGTAFDRSYPGISDMDKASELAAIFRVGEAGEYGLDRGDGFQEQVDDFVETWAGGIIANNQGQIREVGFEAWAQEFPRIATIIFEGWKRRRNAKTNETTEAADIQEAPDGQVPGTRAGPEEGVRTNDARGGGERSQTTSGSQNETVPREETTQGPGLATDAEIASVTGQTASTVAAHNRRFARSLADNLFDVGEVEYTPQTVAGWRQGAEDALLERGVDGAIEEYRRLPAGASEGRKTALGVAIATELYAQGRTGDLTSFGRELTENIGNAAQELRAAALISRLEPAFAQVTGDKITQKALGRGMTNEEREKVDDLARQLQEAADAFAFTQAALDESQATAAKLTAHAADLERLLKEEQNRTGSKKEAELQKALDTALAAAAKYKSKSRATKAPSLRKKIEEERPDLVALLQDKFPGTVLKSSKTSALDPVAKAFRANEVMDVLLDGEFNPHQYSILKKINPADLSVDGPTFDALVKVSAAKLIDELPKGLAPAQFDTWLRQVTNGQMTALDHAAVHAKAYEMSKTPGKPMSNEARVLLRNRLEHAKRADATLGTSEERAEERKAAREAAKGRLKAGEAYRDDRFANRMLETADQLGTDPAAVLMAFGLRETPDPRLLREIYERANGSVDGFAAAMNEGKNLLDSTKDAISIEKAEAVLGAGATEKDIADMKSGIRDMATEERLKRKALQLQFEKLKRTPKRKALDMALSLYNAPRSVMFSGDLGFMFAQGAPTLLMHPTAWFKAMSTGVPAVLTSKRFENTITDLYNSEERKRLEAGGVKFEQIGNVADFNEDFMSDIARHIPIVKQTNQAHSLTTDLFRLYGGTADLAELDGMYESGKLTPTEYNRSKEFLLKKWVNVMSGKGYLGALTPLAGPAAQLGSAPRYTVSAFQIPYYANPIRAALLPKGARSIMMKNSAKLWTPIAMAVAALAKLGLINGDPEDKDFLQIDMGKLAGIPDMKLNLVRALKEPLRVAAALPLKALYYWANGNKEGVARIGTQYKAQFISDPFGGVPSFWASKAHPSISLIGSVYTGKNFSGDPNGWMDVLPAPLGLNEAYKSLTYNRKQSILKTGNGAYSPDNWGRTVAATLGNFIGFGANSFPGSNTTTAAKQLQSMMGGGGDERPQAEKDQSAKANQLERLIREGVDVSEDITALLGSGNITKKQATQLMATMADDLGDVEKRYGMTFTDEEKITLMNNRRALKVLDYLYTGQKIDWRKIEAGLRFATPEENRLNGRAALAQAEAVVLQAVLRSSRLTGSGIGTDDVVEMFKGREGKMSEQQKIELKAILVKKAENANKGGTLDQDEVDRIKTVIPDFTIELKAPKDPNAPKKKKKKAAGIPPAAPTASAYIP